MGGTGGHVRTKGLTHIQGQYLLLKLLFVHLIALILIGKKLKTASS